MAKKGFNLKSLFVKETEEPDSPENPTPAVATATPTPTYFTGPSPTVHNPGGIFDQTIWDTLLSSLEEHNLPGFDLFEFMNAIKAMQSVPMDEPSKYKAIFATASSTDKSVSSEKIIQSSQHYLGILEGEKTKFNQMADSQFQNAVKSKESESQGIDQSIAEKSEQIKRVTQEITELQTKKNALVAESSQAASQIQATRDNFNTTFTALKNKITEEADKIRRYLTAP